ncbi:MAG: VCBS repeat-containing protein, partial [Planctomycetales bacterium]|nr:VCBS repeat-containing protein [Planctomycetales bacterium]
GYWYENQTGEGDFQSHLFANESTTNQTIYADLDRDGDPDLVTSDGVWFENNGSAEFTARALPPMDDQSVLRIQASDVGIDGNVDLLFFGQNNVTLLRNTDGTGNFAVEVSLATPGLIDAGDIDADNDLDLLASHTDGVFHVDWNVDGEFERAVVLEDREAHFEANEVRTYSYSTLALALIDGDQFLDLTFEEFRFISSVEFLWLDEYHWKDLLTESAPTRMAYGCGALMDGYTGEFHLSDWDHDGDMDVWCSGDGVFDATLSTTRNSPPDAFELANSVSLEYGTNLEHFSDAGDINGDGLADYVSDELTDAHVPYWINGVSGKPYEPALAPIFASDPIRFGVEESHRDVAVRNMDADVNLEVLVVSDIGVEIWEIDSNNPNNITLAQELNVLTSQAIDLGDVDADGDLDLAIATRVGNQIWLNDGLGHFANSDQRLGNSNTSDLALGDLDADGDLDLFFANFDSQPNQVWFNNGSGLFSNSGYSLGDSSSTSVALGDIDNDGDLDAVVGNIGTANLVWVNKRNRFTADETFNFPPITNDVVLGDFVKNGRLDIAYINSNQSGTAADMINSQPLSRIGAGMGGAAGDINQDGLLDLIVANGQQQANFVWINPGSRDSDWANTRDVLGLDSSNAVALGDVDLDGDLDVVFANDGRNSIFLNQLNHVDPPVDDHGNTAETATLLATPSPGSFETASGEIDFVNDTDVFSVVLNAGIAYDVMITSGNVHFELAGVQTDRIRLAPTVDETVFLHVVGQPQAYTFDIHHGIAFDIPGDANRDGVFDSADFVQVFQAGQFEDDVRGNSIWETGDWNDDGDFDSADLVYAFTFGAYQK